MKNKDYIIAELEKAIKNAENATWIEGGKLQEHFENVFELIEKSF